MTPGPQGAETPAPPCDRDGCHSNLPQAQGNFWSKCCVQRQRLSVAALIESKQFGETQAPFKRVLSRTHLDRLSVSPHFLLFSA